MTTSKLWPPATKDRPCPICGKPDWCSFGDYQMKCQRIQSNREAKGGGWLHYYPDKCYVPTKPLFVPSSRPKKDPSDFKPMLENFRNFTTTANYEVLSNKLGVKVESLLELDAAWSRSHQAWAFPMRNAQREIVGIRLRSMAGDKWAVKGSTQGLFLPSRVPFYEPAVIVEGPTDAAAALSIGLYPIGRASCTSGADDINAYLATLKARRVVIVADNDEDKICNGRKLRPGIDGALRLQEKLKAKSCIWLPVEKDLRAFVNRGGTKEEVIAHVSNLIWK